MSIFPPSVKPAVMTTGEKYTGNQQFAGTGISKYCHLCKCHVPSTEGWRKDRRSGFMVCPRHQKEK